MSTLAGLPGFRDFYPAELAVRAHIMNAWRLAATRHGFEEYDGPPLEALELYTGKSGEEIVSQLYHFEDKGGRHVALRPEMTPSLARMVAARASALRKPVRWFCMPQLFRYERTQRGRLREHYQWNVDILGEEDVGADAEVLATGLDALALLGLGPEHVVAKFNDRRLLECLLAHAGVGAEQMTTTYAAVDKLAREPVQRIRERLVESGLAPQVAAAVLALFQARGLDPLRAVYGGVPGLDAELERLDAYQRHLTDLGHGRTIAFDLTIVRGLAYYTGTVFEIFDRAGELRAICGGGRYDRLLGAVGGPDMPAVGFGMGDVVLRELLEERKLLPATRPHVDYFIVAVTDEQRELQRRIATRLRSAGHSAVYAFRVQSVGRQFKEADARGAARTLVLGPDEVRDGVALVRVMATGEESRVPLSELL